MIRYVLFVYAIMSAVTFATFAWDKRAARRGLRRVSEATLHTLELLGGWPAALAAMSLIRHKNRKVPYLIVLLGIVALHAAVAVILLRR